MQIVIDLSEEDFIAIRDCHAKIGEDLFNLERNMALAIRNGTPLPKGHGDLIDRNTITVEEDVYFQNYIIHAPTIIEADRGKEE